ncbi:MAG: arsenic efflux protein [Clostridia bacterium]|nr:arsenic efflux protein [Clostridia bacterium]
MFNFLEHAMCHRLAEWLHPLLHGIIDTLNAFLFLFLAYLLMEFIEHKASERMERTMTKIGKGGPAIGSLLGCIPQCGFSATASNLYTAGVVTEGTLIAVFLATSDEAIPILISTPSAHGSIWKIIISKVIIGIVVGFGIDIALKLLKIKKAHVDMCVDCGCEEQEGILKPALFHTLKTSVFILIVNILIGYIIHFVGHENLNSFLLSGHYAQPFITALLGLIPNCAISSAITALYINGSLSFGATIAGLCSGAGVGIAVLLKANPIKKENLRIIITMYTVSAVIGFFLMLFGIN